MLFDICCGSCWCSITFDGDNTFFSSSTVIQLHPFSSCFISTRFFSSLPPPMLSLSFSLPLPAYSIFWYFDKTVKLEVIFWAPKIEGNPSFPATRSLWSLVKSELLECNTKTMLRGGPWLPASNTQRVHLRETHPFGKHCFIRFAWLHKH